MTTDELKRVIAKVVESKQGCKATELVAEPVIAKWHNDFPIVEIIEDMCYRGDIQEVEYILPEMDYRQKSFLLPRGTIISTRPRR